MLFDEYLSEANVLRFIPATGIGVDGSWYNVADIQIRVESVGAYQQMINGQQFAGITHYGFVPIEYDGSVFPNDMISVYKNLVYVYDDVWAITMGSLTGISVLGGVRTTTPFVLYKNIKNTIACDVTLASGSNYAFVGKDNFNSYHVLYSGISSGALTNVEFSYLLDVPITEIGVVWGLAVPTTGAFYYNDSFVDDSEWVVTVSEDTNIYTRGGVRNITVFDIQPNIECLVRFKLTANQTSNISLIGKTSSGTYIVVGSSNMTVGDNIISFTIKPDVQIVELGLIWNSLIPVEITEMYVGNQEWIVTYDRLKNTPKTFMEISNFRNSKVRQYKIVGEPITYEDVFPHIEVNLSKMQYEV